jgi:hypothetical protein
MFEDLIRARLEERRPITIDAGPIGRALGDRDVRTAVAEVSRRLEDQVAEQRATLGDLPGLDPNRRVTAHTSPSDLVRLLKVGPLRPFPDPPPVRDAIVGPPYADDWQAGSGFALGAVADGELFTFNSNGLGLAGVTVALRSTADAVVSATITPLGTFGWNWTSFEDLPLLVARGGLGFSIRHANQTVAGRDAALFDVSGPTRFTGDRGDGALADAASAPAGLFGPFDLFSPTINMAPNEVYLFSVWCWQTATYPDGAAFMSWMTAQLTAVAIHFGPATWIK